MKLCAVVPCYNEEERIAGVVGGLREAGLEDIIVVDDGSGDRTSEKAKDAGAFVIRRGVNGGKGAALKAGMAEATGRLFDAAITLDGDGQHDPGEIPKFRAAAGDFDIIIGNRMAESAKMPWLRRQTNRFTSWVVSALAGARIHDSQSGYRLIRIATWNSLTLTSSRYDLESEIIIRAARKGARIGEVPISAIYHEAAASSINPAVDTYRFLRLALKALFLWR